MSDGKDFTLDDWKRAYEKKCEVSWKLEARLLEIQKEWRESCEIGLRAQKELMAARTSNETLDTANATLRKELEEVKARLERIYTDHPTVNARFYEDLKL